MRYQLNGPAYSKKPPNWLVLYDKLAQSGMQTGLNTFAYDRDTHTNI